MTTNFLQRLDSIIADHLPDEAFTIETLCQELMISYTHTYRLVQQATGLSPSMYICQKRLEKACDYLVNTDWSMSEIAFRVGFNTQSYFSKCFSEAYGCPPLRYRKRHPRGRRA